MVGKYFNGLDVRLVNRTPKNTRHLVEKVLPEIFALKNSRHPSILLTLGVTIYNDQLYLVTEEPSLSEDIFSTQSITMTLNSYLQ